MRRSLLCVIVLTLATMAQAWETTIGEGKLDDGLDVVVDAAGDVVTAGGLATGGQDFAVVKLNGLTGGEIWRYVASGSLGEPDYADQVAVDGSGDVFAIGFIREPGTEASVVKLDGTTGAEIWRRDLPDALSAGTATWLVVAGSGDPVVATGLSVRRIRRSEWRRRLGRRHGVVSRRTARDSRGGRCHRDTLAIAVAP